VYKKFTEVSQEGKGAYNAQKVKGVRSTLEKHWRWVVAWEDTKSYRTGEKK